MGRAWDPAQTSDIALWATVLQLIAWQIALLLPERPGAAAMIGTVVLDIVVLIALIWLRLLVK